MKKVLFISILILCSEYCFSQTKVYKEFYNDRNEITNETDATYYKMGLKRSGDDGFQDTVKGYYIGDRLGSVEFFIDGIRTGAYKIFHNNGKLKETGTFHNYHIVGQQTVYYPNGTKQWILDYPEEPGQIGEPDINDFKILEYHDSRGVLLIVNGTGNCNCNFSEDLREQGRVVQGLRHGKWKGYNRLAHVFTEQYNNGTFVGGVNYTAGNKVAYNKLVTSAIYPGGVENIYKFISSTLQYPEYARRHGLQGKVFVKFIVNKDGLLSDLKVLKGVDPSIDEEAIRVVSLLPKWKPGFVRGSPVTTQFVLPLTFKLH